MSSFAPGDVVVCVDVTPRPNSGKKNLLDLMRIKQGSVYRIAAALLSSAGIPVVRLVGVPHAHSCITGFCAYRFRKIDPATESFTAEMRACRPIKHREPA